MPLLSDALLKEIADTRLAADEWLELWAEALGDCIEALPKKSQALLKRCYSGAETTKTIAGLMGLSATQVYGRLGRASPSRGGPCLLGRCRCVYESTRRVPAFTPDCRFISRDTRHVTRFSAEYFAQ